MFEEDVSEFYNCISDISKILNISYGKYSVNQVFDEKSPVITPKLPKFWSTTVISRL